MDNKIQSLRAREVQATIDDLNQYLEGNVTAEGLVDTLQDMIKFLNQFIFENKTDNFDLKKYLAEGKLLKENIDMATILSHDDYKELYIGNRAEHDASPEEEQFSDEYIIDLKPGMYQMIYWNDEGPDYMNYDNKLEYVKDSIVSYWDIEHFERKFGLTDELDAAGDNWESVFNKHIEDNLDMYYEELNRLINNSEADGDSANGVVLLQNGKVVAGEATNISRRFN